MMLTAIWRVAILFVIALVAVPAISFPSSLSHSSSLVKTFSFNNRSPSTFPANAPPIYRDPQHPEPDNPSLDLPSPPSSHTLNTNATTAFTLLSDPDDDYNYDEYKLDCTGAQYFSPSVEVDCSYIAHKPSSWSDQWHQDYIVIMPPAGLSYSNETSERWANHFMNRLYKIRGLGTKGTTTRTLPQDWWENERNNWGSGITVRFYTYDERGPTDMPVTEQVMQVIREVMCEESVSISYVDEKCRRVGELIISPDDPRTWDNGKEGR